MQKCSSTGFESYKWFEELRKASDGMFWIKDEKKEVLNISGSSLERQG